jgi:hypothetical protein
MLVYELYTFNKEKGYELIGALPERRKPNENNKGVCHHVGENALG